MYQKCSGHHPMECEGKCKMEKEMHHHPMECEMPPMHCKMEKECMHIFKMYRICHYRMYMVCPYCGHEFDYHHHQGMCPHCGGMHY